MKNFYLKNFGLLSSEEKPDNVKVFNEEIDIIIGVKEKEGEIRFRLNVVSYDFLINFLETNINDEGIYLKYSLILSLYDKKEIQEHIEKILQKCKCCEEEEAFDLLKHHFQYEEEEWEY